MFNHPEYDQHERVVHAFDAASGLQAIVAMHSTVRGPAFGGCRMYPYADDAAALSDVLRLSRAMTWKCAIVDVPYGGGKSVILGDPRRQKTPALLHAMGRLVESLDGRYIAADDVGTTLADLAVMRLETRHTAAATATAQQPLAVTAHGVLSAIVAAAQHVLGSGDLKGVKVAVQGLGNVGGPLANALFAKGARLIVSDVDPARLQAADRELGAQSVGPDVIYDADVDIFAPCALGGILNSRTIPRLKVRLVCGGANNQLERADDATRLADRGIVYVPDYLVSAGGVIDFHQERIDDHPDAVLRAVERIGAITADLIVRAKAERRSPADVAAAIVRERLRL